MTVRTTEDSWCFIVFIRYGSCQISNGASNPSLLGPNTNQILTNPSKTSCIFSKAKAWSIRSKREENCLILRIFHTSFSILLSWLFVVVYAVWRSIRDRVGVRLGECRWVFHSLHRFGGLKGLSPCCRNGWKCVSPLGSKMNRSTICGSNGWVVWGEHFIRPPL